MVGAAADATTEDHGGQGPADRPPSRWTRASSKTTAKVEDRRGAGVTVALREPLQHCTEPMATANVVFHVVMGPHGRVGEVPKGPERARLLDIIVLSAAETYGCACKKKFDEGLSEVFGDRLDTTWRSRLHNSVRATIRANNLPCFGKKSKRFGKKSQRANDGTGDAAASSEDLAI